MALEKPAVVKARLDANDADIEKLKQIKEDLRNETTAVIVGIGVQQVYASRLKSAASEIT